MNCEYVHIDQGTPEWLELRKTKITATDACVIMGASPWKTKIQLFQEKKSNSTITFKNERMQRGIDLEPIARDLFILQTGIQVIPKVVVRNWAMASLDGISECGRYIVEIKCPGEKDHSEALYGSVPAHYYPQLQHQIYVCGVEKAHYFSFDGVEGTCIEVEKNPYYIEKMISAELLFYENMQNNVPPEPNEDDYIERSDDLWEKCASQWHTVNSAIKDLEKEQEYLRKQLIFLSGESNSRGGGISLCQIQRKGSVDYSKIPELKTVNLDQYRKAEIKSWRINTLD